MNIYNDIFNAYLTKQKLLAILIDPDKFEVNPSFAKAYLKKIPVTTTHLFIGGSTDPDRKIESVVQLLKAKTSLPIVLFPGNYDQITSEADGILFLSLLSGTNSEYLIGQQKKAARAIQESALEVIPTAYILINGGSETAVQHISQTEPLSQDHLEDIISTSLAGQYLGMKLVYLEAGSGAQKAVATQIVKQVSQNVNIPLIVGGGVRSKSQMKDIHNAGATLVVIGTAFENDSWKET